MGYKNETEKNLGLAWMGFIFDGQEIGKLRLQGHLLWAYMESHMAKVLGARNGKFSVKTGAFVNALLLG